VLGNPEIARSLLRLRFEELELGGCPLEGLRLLKYADDPEVVMQI